jgi:hypothetical protein
VGPAISSSLIIAKLHLVGKSKQFSGHLSHNIQERVLALWGMELLYVYTYCVCGLVDHLVLHKNIVNTVSYISKHDIVYFEIYMVFECQMKINKTFKKSMPGQSSLALNLWEGPWNSLGKSGARIQTVDLIL